MKTNVLVAILAGLMGRAVDPRLLPTERRTVKVRPVNYTHPMVVSSPKDINAHNGRVALAKQDRKLQRERTRRTLIEAGARNYTKDLRGGKKTAYLRKYMALPA